MAEYTFATTTTTTDSTILDCGTRDFYHDTGLRKWYYINPFTPTEFKWWENDKPPLPEIYTENVKTAEEAIDVFKEAEEILSHIFKYVHAVKNTTLSQSEMKEAETRIEDMQVLLAKIQHICTVLDKVK
jgi:hypothetical protein